MKQIICPLTFAPIRKDSSHISEQVSQLLFGETASVIKETNEWLEIETHFDKYKGWVEKKVIRACNENRTTPPYINAFARMVSLNGDSLWLSTGSEISSELLDSKSSTIVTINPELDTTSIVEIGLQFLGTPYLWGGRSFMGIDCSGFTQVVFKALNMKLPRDASEQVNIGEEVLIQSEIKAGDLAFFENEAGKISHVGIMLDSDKIIHASGSVRIDSFDKKGIYNSETSNYSHKLKIIKRLI